MATATLLLENQRTGVFSSPTTTASHSLTVGRGYVLFISASAVTDVTPPTIADPRGNTWTHYTTEAVSPVQTRLVTVNPAPRNIFIYTCEPSVGGADTLEITHDALNEINWTIIEAASQKLGSNGAAMIGQAVPIMNNEALNQGLLTGTGATDGQQRYLEQYRDANSVGVCVGVKGLSGADVAWSYSTGWTELAQRAGLTFRFYSAKTTSQQVAVGSHFTGAGNIHNIHCAIEILDAAAPATGSCLPLPVIDDSFFPYTRSLLTTGAGGATGTPVILPAPSRTFTLVTGRSYLVTSAALRTNDPRTPSIVVNGASGWTVAEIGAGDTRNYNTIASPDIRLCLFRVSGGTGAAGVTFSATYTVNHTVHGLELFDLGADGTNIDTAQGTGGIIQSVGAVADSGSTASATLSAFADPGNTFMAVGAIVTAVTSTRPRPPANCRLLNRQRDYVSAGLAISFAAVKRGPVSGSQSFAWNAAGDNAVRLLEIAGVVEADDGIYAGAIVV